MQITNSDLIAHLFQAMQRVNHDNDGSKPLSDEQMRLEIEKAQTVSDIADRIIDAKKLEYLHNKLVLDAEKVNARQEDADKRIIVGNDPFFNTRVKGIKALNANQA